MEYFIFNGKLLKAESGIIGPDSRGLRFGDGLFETIKSINGQLEFIDEHFARLWKGMQVLQFAIPKQFTPDILEQEIQSLLKKNGHDKMARVRLTVFRGDGGLYDTTDHKPNYLLQSWALPDETGNWNSNGLVLGVYTDIKKSCDILSNLKHNNFLPYVMAALYAKKEKWNDAVLLNTEGRLCDTTIANIFLIKDEVIYTPALAEGCIAGVMRRNLVEKLTAGGYKLVEDKLSVDELLYADEVFLTNSIYNMRWVQSVGDKKYSNAQTQKIYAAFFSTNS
ncbi:MAG: aminotransferase class IV [Chitinophagaceae bacterium]|nr:aminotransferase class IV [Chitinophagaceae bacterium]